MAAATPAKPSPYPFPNNSSKSLSDRANPSRVKPTDFAFPLGSNMYPFWKSRSMTSKSNPFHARPPSCSVKCRSARTQSSSCQHPHPLRGPNPVRLVPFTHLARQWEPFRVEDAFDLQVDVKLRPIQVMLSGGARRGGFCRPVHPGNRGMCRKEERPCPPREEAGTHVSICS